MSLAAKQPVTQDIPRANALQALLDNERFLAGVMLFPAVLYIVLLVGFPFVMAILYSFSDITEGSPEIDRLTLDTFISVFQDRVFRTALWNTFLFSFASQVIVIFLANILALALTAEAEDSPLHRFISGGFARLLRLFRVPTRIIDRLTRRNIGLWLVRLLLLLPWATPIAIGALTWWLMLDSVYGPLDWIFRQVGLLGPGGTLDSANSMYWRIEYARFSVILIYVWRILPMSTVILMAGLTSIPKDVKDAVAIDGVGFWTQFFEVTVPLLRPVLLVAFLFGIIFTFTDMTVIYIVTQGGPTNITQVLPSWAYYQGIEGGSLAEGAATAIFMLPVLFGVAFLMLRMARRAEVS